jgi:predicted O-methyltransferase YrrM
MVMADGWSPMLQPWPYYNRVVIVPTPVQDYLATLAQLPHPELEAIHREGVAEGVPIVDRQSGALLHALVRASRATRVLEVGTALGYSGLWMATALPADGLLITLERDRSRAERARAHFEAAGVGSRVTVMIGDASQYLHKIAGPFDLVFQDADKAAYGALLDRLVALLRPGGLLVTDNVLWSGEVVPGFVDPPRRAAADTAAIAAYNQQLAGDARLFTTFLPVGDGVALSVKQDSIRS